MPRTLITGGAGFLGSHLCEYLPDAGRCTGFMLWTLKVNGEPWLWSIQPDKIGQVLKENGWTYSPESVGEVNKRGVEYFGVARNIRIGRNYES